MTDRNVHADHAESIRPNCELAGVWTRDPLDGRDIGDALSRLAQRRGLDHVLRAVLVWAASHTPPAPEAAHHPEETSHGPTHFQR